MYVFLEAVELAVQRAPVPSPFEMASGVDRKKKEAEEAKKKKKPEVSPAGTKADLASWTDDTHVKMGPLIYDAEAIANEYQLVVADMCWPVLLVLRLGSSLCPVSAVQRVATNGRDTRHAPFSRLSIRAEAHARTPRVAKGVLRAEAQFPDEESGRYPRLQCD